MNLFLIGSVNNEDFKNSKAKLKNVNSKSMPFTLILHRGTGMVLPKILYKF